MNRILLEPDELRSDGAVALRGRRAAHLIRILAVEPGQMVRVGVVDGAVGRAEVVGVSDGRVDLACRFEEERPPPARVDLLLALPRPKVMRRLWLPLASMGVGRVILTNAAKVERNYFDTHWLDESTYRPLLLQGLEQSGDTRLPAVSVHRRFRPLVEDELGALSPGARHLVLHPREAVPVSGLALGPDDRVLVAIGPEGGWTSFELELLAASGFERVSLGWRTLRSDTACIAGIAALQAMMGD